MGLSKILLDAISMAEQSKTGGKWLSQTRSVVWSTQILPSGELTVHMDIFSSLSLRLRLYNHSRGTVLSDVRPAVAYILQKH